MIAYAEEVKKEHYPYTAKDSSDGTNKWENAQNVISKSDNYAQCVGGRGTISKLDITFSPLSGFNIKQAYLKISCYASSSMMNLHMYDSAEKTQLYSNSFPTSKTIVTSSKDVASFINLEKDTTFRVLAESSMFGTAYIYSVYLELIGEEQGNNKTIYLGANNIQNIYIGNNNISSVYLGDSLIYSN